MKKSIYAVASLFFLAVATASAEEIRLSGDGGSGGGASLTCAAGTNNVSLAYDPGMLVRTGSEKSAAGFVKTTGTGGKSVFVLNTIPDGTKIYLMGLGKDWGKMSRDVDNVDVSKALASGKFQSGSAAITLPYRGDENYAMINAVAVTPNGTHAWAGVEGSQFSVKGPKGPFLLIAKNCNAPSDAAKQAAIAIESRK